MNIAIIGTGNIGSGLAATLAKAGNQVTVTDTENGTEAAAKISENGANVSAAPLAEAVASAETVILAVPYNAVADIAGKADFNGKIVIDLINPVTEDFSALQIGHTTSSAEETAKLLTGARVVKAFNTVFADLYPKGLDFNGTPVQTFVASDDEDAKAKVIALAEGAGFSTLNAGGLQNARYLEPLGYMNIQFGFMLGQGTQITPVWLKR